ncbi:MAG: LL-diaminopimelate aminotransferase [Candidatus Micrarchaeota archaeon]|nr:LL-diaminopimelate aminotransferase [Candidatus Micrarchaeota archaeon]
MATINSNYNKLKAGYLFPEIARRTKEFQEKNPGVEIMRLGIGNTTEPLAPHVIEGLHRGVDKLAKVETYTGYGDEQGNTSLRKAIAEAYKSRLNVTLEPTEIFISDGAKCDSANIQTIFGTNNIVAVQDPAYPVYVDTNIIAGREIVYMPCNEKNYFFPEIPSVKVDLIYLCSPNNPTGAVPTRQELYEFVKYAKQNKAVIIFDAAYSEYISNPSLPKSIYEIDGAKECAIEVNSFSKSAGFTGVRLGFTIVPYALVAEDTTAGRVNQMWNRRQTTFFNGASNIVQEGGLSAMDATGYVQNMDTVRYYMENARIIRHGLMDKFVVYGGKDAPFLWVKTPNGMDSWKFFDKMLEEAHVVITPGSGFGPSGEGFFRVSAFGHRSNVEKAVVSIQKNLRV